MAEQKIDRIENLVSHLQTNDCISFFNYHIVEYIINKFGDDADKGKLHDYENKLAKFCRRSVFEIPQDIFGPVPKHKEKLAFKVTQKLQVGNLPSTSRSTSASTTFTLSLEDVQTIRETVAKALCLENGRRLTFLGASKGCVELTFSAPRDVIDMMKTQLRSSAPTESGNGSSASLANLEKIGIHLLCGPPGKPHVFKATGTSVSLQWSKPEYRGFHPIQYYLVHCQLVNNPNTNLDTLQTRGEKPIVEIMNLPQNGTLIIKVQAVTTIGHGIESDHERVKLSCTNFRRQSERRASFSSQFASVRPRAYTSTVTPDLNTDILNKDHFDELVIKLSTLRSRNKWYEIGDKLGLKPEILNRIKRDYNNNQNLCLRNMLTNWLDQGNASKKALCEALKAVGLHDQSDDLAAGSFGTWKVTAL